MPTTQTTPTGRATRRVLRAVRRTLTLVALAGLTLSGGDATAQQALGFRVVVHADSPVDTLLADELSKMFLKRSTRWSDDTPVRPVDQPGHAPVREAFSRAVHERAAKAIVAHWQQQIFSGRAVPPLELAGDELVVSYVAVNPGAIGYVSPGASVRGVKIVEIRR
jgi:ABC-type phosphate transport system substrate-binding protein